VALIAPTEILAEQHFNFFISCLKEYDYFGVALLTSRGAKIWPSKTEKNKVAEVPKTRIKRLLENGQVHIVIGTHALFNKNVLFENLGLIILDEQHRFGVKQRKALIENNKENKVVKAKNDLREIQSDRPIPHLLSMSATPIPRTLALTIYGDLDLSILSELPPGRKRATTKVVDKYKREEMYETFVNEIKKGRQGYIIAPRITHDENTSTKSSVEYEEKRIKEKYPKLKIGVLHGKDKNKDETIQKFYKHELDILISTTVIEVGVSVPNATVMIIENAETFGLAQLHQLRGRVERSSNESFCFLASDSLQENSLKRLSALEKTSNGFDLAEVDLLERGAGSLIGNRQSGLTDVGMEAIKNRKLVETAKHEAENLIGLDPELLNHPKLKNALEIFSFHNE
jgi:ATP-dependent DNA helicase RecG